jgi:RNA polymerase sigma factor (sigma-70 family)
MSLPPKDLETARWFAGEIQPHEPQLRAYLRGRFPSLKDIDDLVQETYARLFRAHHAGKQGLSRAYLFVTARNAALDLFRRKKIVSIEAIAEIENLSVVEDGLGVAETLCHQQELELLAEALDTLPKRCRQIFVMRRFHDLSHREIALALGVSENTVNAQLVIGMTRCRAYLRAKGVTAENHHEPLHS